MTRSTGTTLLDRADRGVALGEHAAARGAIADRDHPFRRGRRGVSALQRDPHVVGHRPGHQQHVGVARRGRELDAEALDVIDRVVERVDLQLAAVAGAGIDLADGDRAAEQPACPHLQRARRARPGSRPRSAARRIAAAPDGHRALRTAIGAAACASEVVPRIGAIERLVAEREVGDDVAFDRGLQQRPLEPRASRAWRARCGRRRSARQTSTSPRNASIMATPSRVPRRRQPTRHRAPPADRQASCSSSAMLCSTSRMRTQMRASTSPAVSTGTSKRRLIIGRIGQVAAAVEVAARGAADIAAGGPLLRPVLADHAGGAGAVLQRRRIVIEPHDFGKRRLDLVEHDCRAPAQRRSLRPRCRPARCGPSSGDDRRRGRPPPARARGRCRNGRGSARTTASLQIAPISPKWLATRSSSAMTPRRILRARRRIDASATSTARAKAKL